MLENIVANVENHKQRKQGYKLQTASPDAAIKLMLRQHPQSDYPVIVFFFKITEKSALQRYNGHNAVGAAAASNRSRPHQIVKDYTTATLIIFQSLFVFTS